MQIGSLVRITDVGPEDTRGIGTVLKFDMYNSKRPYPAKSVVDLAHITLHVKSGERITEVLWSDAHIGWVLQKRLEVLNEIR